MRVPNVMEHAQLDDWRYAYSYMDANPSVMPTNNAGEQLPTQRVVQGTTKTERAAASGIVLKEAQTFQDHSW
jgi:hypothetical protein